MSAPTSNNIRVLFSEIIVGYSRSFFNSVPIYIKHLNNLDLSEIDYQYNLFLKDCIKKGVPTIEEKTKYLIENNLWDKKQEDKLDEFKKTKNTFQINKSNEYLRSKRQNWQKEIDKINEEIRKIEDNKSILLGLTAEVAANRKINNDYIKLTFYQDPELKNKLFNEETFNDLDNDQTNKIFEIFNEYATNFSQENIKKISISNFFMNMFNLAAGNITDLYGKNIINLSVFQIDCWNFSKFFRNAIDQLGRAIPPEVQENPDDLMEFIEVNVLFKRVEEKMGEEGAVSLMGASKSDMKALGIETNQQFSLDEQLKKNKGRLTMDQMVKMHK